MKYDLIEIKPNSGEWNVSWAFDDRNRIPSQSTPHSLGFFYFPRRMGINKAFFILKNHLIKKHTEEIKRLQKSLSKLKKLKAPVKF